MRITTRQNHRRLQVLACTAGALLTMWACSADSGESSATSTSGNAQQSSATTGSAAGGAGGATSSGSMMAGAGGFSPTTSGAGGGGQRCSAVLLATVRDLMLSHPDFETFGGQGATTGLVETTLGADKKPVFKQSGGQITSAMTFAEWYNDVNGINQAFEVELQLVEITPGVYSYANSAFFPIDGQGWGNEGNPHNFHFTTEIHAEFEYLGGEVFTFNGDDDLWVFINNQLAIDLGGLHSSIEGSVVLDDAAGQLGIVPGNIYPMDLFHAERHTTESNFRVDTTIACFVPPPQ